MTLDDALRAVVLDAVAPLKREIQELRAKIDPPAEWLTAQDMARHLGCSVQTVRRKARIGEIEVKGSGKARRYRA